MNRFNAKHFWIVGLTVIILSFALLFIGVKGVLRQPVTAQNLLAYTLLSLIFGSLTGAFYALRLKAAFFLFAAGLVVGFFMMYLQFISGMDGWSDLTGLISLFFCTGIGLTVGLLVQIVWFLIQKSRQNKTR